MLSDELAIEPAGYRERQDEAREAVGEGWVDSGRVFTAADGAGLHPALVSAWFKQLVREADLPPIRLRDLRHGAASLMLAANVDIKVVSELLGHSGTTIRQDRPLRPVEEVIGYGNVADTIVFPGPILDHKADDPSRG